jgi:dTDP-4-dehydrorhamnose 3,5-epimerase-like enzyme
MPLLAFEDHLLRRFGAASLVRMRSEQVYGPRARRVADEVWALVSGAVEVEWHDLRENSPTHRRRFRLTLDTPTLFLVPFGVAFACRCLSPEAALVAFASHAEEEVHDVLLPDTEKSV